MKELIDLYDIEVLTNKIKIEVLYINKNIDLNDRIVFEDINTKKIIPFTIKADYIVNGNKNGYRCNIILPLNKCQNYILKIKNSENYKDINWSNNQNKPLEFSKNKFHIFSKNNVVILNNNGISIKKKHMFSKLLYSFNKLIYGITTYKKIYVYRLFKTKQKYYLINDRVSEGNDNGEALFRYICQNDKELAKNTYYVIKKNTNKYKELRKIGNVLKFGSVKHKIKFINSKIIATSYIGNGANVYNPFNNDEMEIYRDLINKKTIFLQHGILMADFHMMFNKARMAIDKFVISTNFEYQNIIKQGYLYDEADLIKTGLARYDLLNNNKENKILIFFTWRKWLSKISEQEFIKSEYYKTITSLLTNKELNKIINKFNYKIEIVLHAELTNYYNLFEKFNNDYIKVLKSSDIVYFEKFSSCNMLITDYSSIHFDVAFLNKPIIYYQFDYDDFCNNHTSSGISNYSYKENGFGDVLIKENEIISKVKFYFTNNFQVEEKYEERLNNTFFHKDKNNSKRLLKCMKELDCDDSKNYRFNNVQ